MDSLPDDKNVRMLCLYDNEEVIISQCIVLTTCIHWYVKPIIMS